MLWEYNPISTFTFCKTLLRTCLSSVQIWGENQTSVSSQWRIFLTMKRNIPGLVFHAELSWLFWLLWQTLVHFCVNIEKGQPGCYEASTSAVLSAGGQPVLERCVIKRPSSCKWETVTRLWTVPQQLQLQTRLTVSDRNLLWVGLQDRLLHGSAPQDKTGSTHLCSHVASHSFTAWSNAVAHIITYSSIYYSCDSQKLYGSGWKAFVWSKRNLFYI